MRVRARFQGTHDTPYTSRSPALHNIVAVAVAVSFVRQPTHPPPYSLHKSYRSFSCHIKPELNAFKNRTACIAQRYLRLHSEGVYVCVCDCVRLCVCACVCECGAHGAPNISQCRRECCSTFKLKSCTRERHAPHNRTTRHGDRARPPRIPWRVYCRVAFAHLCSSVFTCALRIDMLFIRLYMLDARVSFSMFGMGRPFCGTSSYAPCWTLVGVYFRGAHNSRFISQSM